jgi:hypothetical protein
LLQDEEESKRGLMMEQTVQREDLLMLEERLFFLPRIPLAFHLEVSVATLKGCYSPVEIDARLS